MSSPSKPTTSTSTPTPTPTTSSSPPPPPPPVSDSSFTSPRSLRQLSLFAGGASFFLLSSLITRRSLVRRYKAVLPKFYTPSNRANYDINGAMEAFEALNIATINVASVGLMATGGLLWAFDISSLEELRTRVRRRMGSGVGGFGSIGVGKGETDGEAEEQIEKWFEEVLQRKEFKVLRGEKGVKDGDAEAEKTKENAEKGKKA